MPDQDQAASGQAYMQEFEAKVGAAFNHLAKSNEQLQAQLHALSQQRGAPPPPPPPPQQLPENANALVLEQFATNPVRVLSEVAANAVTQAERKFETRLQAERDQNAANAAFQNFWGGFVQHNPDMAPFLTQIQTEWQRSNIPDPSQRADTIAANLRQHIAAQRADAVEADRRQRGGQRMAAGAPGMPFTPGAEMERGDGQSAQPRNPALELHEAIMESRQRQAKHRWTYEDERRAIEGLQKDRRSRAA